MLPVSCRAVSAELWTSAASNTTMAVHRLSIRDVQSIDRQHIFSGMPFLPIRDVQSIDQQLFVPFLPIRDIQSIDR